MENDRLNESRKHVKAGMMESMTCRPKAVLLVGWRMSEASCGTISPVKLKILDLSLQKAIKISK